MILFDINSAFVPNFYQCHNHDEHHNLTSFRQPVFWWPKPGETISLVEVISLWTSSQIISLFASEACWQTSWSFCKVWANSSGLMSTRGISWSSSISGAKSFCSSPTLSTFALLGTTNVPWKFSTSFTKSRRFRFIMELRSKSRRFRLIMELRSMLVVC